MQLLSKDEDEDKREPEFHFPTLPTLAHRVLTHGLIFKDAAELQGYLPTTGLSHVAASNCGTADNPDCCRLS